MRFICSTFGSSGDVFPMLGLALELGRRGHDVTFATNEHYRSLAQKYSLPFESLGTEADFVACIKNPDLWHPRRAFRHLMESLQRALKRQYEIHAERAGADVVAITNCFGLGALNAQDKLGMPVITLHLQPAVIWSYQEPPSFPAIVGPRWLKSLIYRLGERFFLDPAICPFLNAWRYGLGLPPVRKITHWWHSRYGVLCMFPAWYCRPQSDWPANVMQTGFPLWNDKPDQRLAADVEAFLACGEPPVVFTPGSANQHGKRFFESAVHACLALHRRGILLTEFPEQLPIILPESVVHFSYVPLDLLLPRALAFVHHGGIGSTSQAMLAGIPQVLMPLAHDQFDNAERVKRMGIGDSIPAQRFSCNRLTQVLQQLLDSTAAIGSCRTIAERLSKRDGLCRSADAIEERVSHPPNR